MYVYIKRSGSDLDDGGDRGLNAIKNKNIVNS
jgi:hypothetical protein